MTDKPLPLKARRRPPPFPESETIQRGSVSVAINRAPLQPVASDTATRWLPVRQAAGLISTSIANPIAAENEIINLALSGLIRLSCEGLNVQTLAGDTIFTVMRPGDDAGLANRINKARKSGLSAFFYSAESGFATWLDLSNFVRVNVHRLLVDADGVAAFFANAITLTLEAEAQPAEAGSVLAAIREQIGSYDAQGPFLPVADKHVGYPLTPTDFIKRGISSIYGQDWVKTTKVETAAKMMEDYSLTVLSTLSIGELDAFVENPRIGRWFRVPSAYWLCWGSLPNSLKSIVGSWPGLDKDMIGMPIVLWEEAVEATFLEIKSKMDAVNVHNPAPDSASVLEDNVSCNASAPDPSAFNRFTPWSEKAEWYEARVRMAPPQGFTRIQDEKDGRVVGISRDDMRSLRKEHAPQEWGKSGAKGTRRK